MKKWTVCAYALAWCLTSCENDPSREVDHSQTSYTIRINIQPHAQIEPFPDVKSIPDGIPHEPTLPTEKEFPFLFIEYAVYDLKADTLVHHYSLSKEYARDGEFGAHLYDTLQTGKYRLCFLAHSISERSPMDTKSFTFPRTGDIFYTSKDITVDESIHDTPVEVLLKRKVSRVEFVPKDTLPEQSGKLQIIADKIYNTFNIYTGLASPLTIPLDTTIQFSKSVENNSPSLEYGFFTFVPEDNEMHLVKINTYDNQNNLIRHREINQLPIYENRITRYTMILFHAPATEEDFQIDLEIDEEWGEDIDRDIND
ncbi:MAG: FimB/Mfa2 family fimbrial subunit [Tannerellaceae bacterium]|nr:FimB/Mfa2 family fimbrial subunit [Tannerellaceae bacterium]